MFADPSLRPASALLLRFPREPIMYLRAAASLKIQVFLANTGGRIDDFERLFQVTYKDREKKKWLYPWSTFDWVRAGGDHKRGEHFLSTSFPPLGVDFSPSLCIIQGECYLSHILGHFD